MASIPKSNTDQENWSLIIRPQRGWFDLRLGEVWRVRELIMLFVWRDFVSVYKQTVLGPLWHFIQPLVTSVVFTVVFGNIARLPTDNLPQFVFYMSGNVIWYYFSACVNKTSSTFTSNSYLFGKVYFPRLAVPISTLISNLIAFGIQFGMFLGFVVYYVASGAPVKPNLWALATPLILLLLAAMGLGVGITVSSLTTRYRDMQNLVGFGLTLLMYTSPVIIPLSAMPAFFRQFISLNPVSPLIELFRYAWLGSGTINLNSLIYSVVFTAVALFLGLLLFNRVEGSFMDTV